MPPNKHCQKRSDKEARSDISVIPGCLTGLVQSADVSWNKPFKQAYKELYNEWLACGEKTYTSGGKVRAAPSKLLWVKQAWNCVSKEMAIKSFESCGISVYVDGKEDDKIYFYASVGGATEAYGSLFVCVCVCVCVCPEPNLENR